MKKFSLVVAFMSLYCFSAFAADPVVTVLDTTVSDTGNTQTVSYTFLKTDVPLRMVADIGSGDSVVVQGRANSSGAWVTIYTFTADEWKDIWVSAQWRAIRSVDGGSADSTLQVLNVQNLPLVAHE